jgi:plasmid stabilization system protein ParE
VIRRVIVQPAATRDIREARQWYRGVSHGLANDFLAAVDAAIALAKERPLAFQLVHRSFRRILLRRFPYALFYLAEADRIVIVAVLSQARHPNLLDGR